MKKMIFLTCFVFLMGSLYAQNTSDFEVQGNDDNTMTILNYKGQAKNIVIPDKIFNMPVTRLQKGAFQGKGLTSATIPATITFIGDNTFEGNSLTMIVLPNALEYIGNGTFKNNKLTSIAIPANVATIGSQAFYGNDLTSIVIPDSVKYIGNEAFRRNLITNIKIGNGVIFIGDYAFYSDGRNSNSGNSKITTDLTIGNNVIHIGLGAFSGIDMTSSKLPNTLVYIGQQTKTGKIIDSMTTRAGSGTVTVSSGAGGSLLCIQSRFNPPFPVPANWDQVGSFEVGTSFDGIYTTTVSKRSASGEKYSLPINGGNGPVTTLMSFADIWDYEVFHNRIYENSARNISIDSNNNGRPTIFIVAVMYAWPSTRVTMTPANGVTVFDAPEGTFRSNVQFLVQEDKGGTKTINISDYSMGDGRTLVVGLYLK